MRLCGTEQDSRGASVRGIDEERELIYGAAGDFR